MLVPEDDDGLDWLVNELGRVIVESDPEDSHLLPVAPCSNEVDVYDALYGDSLPLPGNPCRATCKRKRQCTKRVMDLADDLVHHLSDQVRDKQVLLELVNLPHLGAEAPGTRHHWKLAGLTISNDAMCVLLGISKHRLKKTMRSLWASGMCPYSDNRPTDGGRTQHHGMPWMLTYFGNSPRFEKASMRMFQKVYTELARK